MTKCWLLLLALLLAACQGSPPEAEVPRRSAEVPLRPAVLPRAPADWQDEAERQAQSLAETGAPSPTPELDALAAMTVRMTPGLGLEPLLGPADVALPPVLLRPGDLLAVSVYGRPELSEPLRVYQDGTIHVFLLGTLTVAGQTCEEAAAAIREGFVRSAYLKRAEVFVRLQERAQPTVQVVGRVKQPGLHELPLDELLSVHELVTRVKGFAADADSDRLALIRRGAKGTQRCFHFSYAELLDARVANREAWLQPGDQLVVPRLPRVYVLGQVQNPGPQPLRPGSTVTTILLGTGGLTEEADGNELRVLRGDRSLKASLGSTLEPDDVVFVPRRQRVYLVGPGVVRNGPIDLPSSGLTLVQAVAEAGWFTAKAKLNSVEILRNEGPRQVRIPVPVQQVLDGERNEADFPLRPGDLVFVPESIW